MNCLEQYLVKLLQGYITYDDRIVEVRKQFSNNPQLPVITLDLSPGVTTNYSYHDTDNRRAVLYFHRSANVNVNLWCNTEDEREQISQMIMQCFYMEKTNHFRYCSQYEDGVCVSTGESCLTGSVVDGRTVKNKCPYPDRLGYESLQEACHIVWDTVRFEPPFDLDEEDRHPPLLRSVFRVSADYYEPVVEHGVRVEDVSFGKITDKDDEGDESNRGIRVI